ncbi:MAG: glycosyltransferase family 2 protein [Pseudobdellovibrio sp.]
MFKVAVFASDENVFIKIQNKLKKIGIESLFADSSRLSRLDFLNVHLNEWLFFIDHDCELSEENVVIIRGLIQRNASAQNVIFAALYADAEHSKFLQKAHNFIANQWVSSSYEQAGESGFILGGAFLAYACQKIEGASDSHFWGAEDKYMAMKLNESGYKFKLVPELKIKHLTSPALSHFVKRSYLHGKNDVLLLNQRKDNINYLYWLKKIDFLNPGLVFPVLLHYVVLKLARSIQTVRRMNK